MYCKCLTSALLLAAASVGQAYVNLPKVDFPVANEVVADGLMDPAGLAVCPISKRLFVAERGADRISVVHAHQAVPVLVSGHFMINGWAGPYDEVRELNSEKLQEPRFHTPQSLAFDGEGRLFVGESGPDARLLRFEPVGDGLAMARLIQTPWQGQGVAYDHLAVDESGVLYCSTRKGNKGGLTAGSVVARDVNDRWALVDYGPFSLCGGVAVHPNGTLMVALDDKRNELVWYDAERGLELGSTEMPGKAKFAAILPDGNAVVAAQMNDQSWSLVEVQPAQGKLMEWVGGLGRIGGLHVNPLNGDIYVSLPDSGRIMRFRSLADEPRDENAVDRLLHVFEIEKALPPKDWPEFFREFIENLGVISTVDGAGGAGSGAGRNGMSIDEFTDQIPVIAGKFSCRLVSPPELDPDPIEELSFVLLCPNRNMRMKGGVSPSVSLFHAVRRSGRVSQTHFLPGAGAGMLSDDMDWRNLPDVVVSLPAGYSAGYNPMTAPGLLRVYFMGMGLGPDYWIDVNRKDVEQNALVVENPDGTRIHYRLDPHKESFRAGGSSVLMAGLQGVRHSWRLLDRGCILNHIAGTGDLPLKTRSLELMAKNLQHLGQPVPKQLQACLPQDTDKASPRTAFQGRVLVRAVTRWENAHF